MAGPSHPSNGRLLQALAVGHAVVGAVIYRRELTEIRRAGILASVPYKGPRATVFWFLFPSPLLWTLGRGLHEAEQAGDAEALRRTSGANALSAILALICLPVSGFWVWLAISLRGLRDARRMGT